MRLDGLLGDHQPLGDFRVRQTLRDQRQHFGLASGQVAHALLQRGARRAGIAIALENLFPPLPSEVILPLAGFTAFVPAGWMLGENWSVVESYVGVGTNAVIASARGAPGRHGGAAAGDRPRRGGHAGVVGGPGEAVTNAAKHSRATLVTIDVRRQGTMVVVRVEDDGMGGADATGGGLTGLAQRVAALDGRFTLTSPPGGPTVMEAEMPCA
ncbi:hypothetical protein EDD27_7994 [Nonomuraea polychroma]|uniref:histidine kinase n=1 Tax=Nonomuraea polychroma TaxID=46176 RepID=A0A438MHE5_9ACTN|nr:hypothetical protein EDD27_7994 [Nonomuraea polychroma]